MIENKSRVVILAQYGLPALREQLRSDHDYFARVETLHATSLPTDLFLSEPYWILASIVAIFSWIFYSSEK